MRVGNSFCWDFLDSSSRLSKKVATRGRLALDSTPPAERDSRRLNANRLVLASHRCCRRGPRTPSAPHAFEVAPCVSVPNLNGAARPRELGTMVVSATRPPEGLGDALLLVDAILDTAKDLKASLNQAKRANTPAALAAASATLGLSRTLAGYARDTHLLLSKSVPAWLPAAPSPRSARASDAKSTARSLRASFASSGVTKRPAKLGVGLAAETAAAADGARRDKEKASAAPSTPAAAKKPEALEALEAYGTPKAQGTQGTQGIGGAIATGAELEDMVPRDSETSPTPTAKSSAEGARPVSARVERVGASASAAASRSRARPSWPALVWRER